MFNNIGKKLQDLAIVSAILGIIISIILGILLIIFDSIFIGILAIVFGSLSSWIRCWATYALGQLIEDSEYQTHSLQAIQSRLWDIESRLKRLNQENAPTIPIPPQSANETPNPISEEPTLSLDDKTKEATYDYAVQMYKQGRNEIAYNAFLKITG